MTDHEIRKEVPMTPSPLANGRSDRAGCDSNEAESESSLNVLSLFAGAGGLELGLERAGMTVVGQVERDPYCQQVLARHWPEVPKHDDVLTAPEWWGASVRPVVDLVCGGFPLPAVQPRRLPAGRG